MADKRVVWQPQPRQVEFLRRPEYEVLYGGAAGGGKTDALLMFLLKQIEIPHYKGILFRKTYPELEEVISRTEDLYPKIVPGCRFNDNKHVWRFPSGARVYLGAMQHIKDRIKFQGKQYDVCAFDELTHFSYAEYSYLFSRNRPARPGTWVVMRAATNPGGIGHSWVKERFIAGRVPQQSYSWELEIRGVKYKRHRAFIPATVFDNTALLQNDPMYIANLAMLPEAERKALLEGDWDTFSGQAFVEWRDDPAGYRTRRWTHVIQPFAIPETWRIFRSFDFGYAKPFSVAWWAVDYDDRVYRIRELYGCTGQPNTGVRWDVGRIADEIKRIESEKDGQFVGRQIYGVADPSIWDASRGESIADMMQHHGVYWTPGDNERIPGKHQVHYRLAFDKEGLPAFYVFANCAAFIRSVPSLVYDETDVEDIDSAGEDHVYDETRYFLMEHPIGPRYHHAPPAKLYDPLDLDDTNVIGPSFITM
jgi:hypothetical protein